MEADKQNLFPFKTITELDAGLDAIRSSPRDQGRLDLIVTRPRTDKREIQDSGELSLEAGLVGDNWLARGGHRGQPANLDRQLNIMNSRAITVIAGGKENWAPAGDQLYVDFDLSEDNVPAGTQLAIGEAVIEVTPAPHNGCKKFANRFGTDAVKWVNSPEGKRLHLRGICAKTLRAGVIRSGDSIRKV